MAKEMPHRTSPHASVAVAQLQKLGMSSVGARQAAAGQMVTRSDDRLVLAQILAAATERSSHIKLKNDVMTVHGH